MNLLRNRPQRGVILGAMFFTALMTICYLFVDLPLANAVHPYRGTELYHWAEFFTDFGDVQWYFVPTLSIALVCLPFRRDISSKCMYIFCSICAAGIFNYLLKILLGRARPSRHFSEDIYGFYFFETSGSYFSFPSGHTAVFFSAFAAFGVLAPRFRVLFLVIAGALSFTRVLVEMHYLSDIIAGGLVGTLVAHLLASWWHRPRTVEEPEMEELGEEELEAESKSG